MKVDLTMKVLFVIVFCYACQSQAKRNDGDDRGLVSKSADSLVDIDSVYRNIYRKGLVAHEQVSGKFVNVENDEKTGRRTARFIGEGNSLLGYEGYASDRSDAVLWKKGYVRIKYKLDPGSMTVYRVSLGARQFLSLIGKGQSASGTGVRVTFFVLLELDKKGEVITSYEFESRFGSINNLVDYDGDGMLDYFKVVNGEEDNEYLLTVHGLLNGSQIGTGSILLKYKLNDRFVILENRWYNN